MMGCNSFNRIYHLSNNKELHNFYSSRTEAPKKSASIVEKLLEGEEAPPVNVKLFLKYFFNKHQTLLFFLFPRISGNSSRSCGSCEIRSVTEVAATEAGLSLLQGVPAYVEGDPYIISRELDQGWLKICVRTWSNPRHTSRTLRLRRSAAPSSHYDSINL